MLIDALIDRLDDCELIAVRHEELYRNSQGQSFLIIGNDIHSMSDADSDKWLVEFGKRCQECSRLVKPEQTRCYDCDPEW